MDEAKAISLINTWRNSPVEYFRKALNVKTLWDGEEAFLQAVPIAIKEKKNLVITSGHSLGKDFIAGGLVPYFLHVWAPCIVITTAPTDRQVDAVMWGEIKNHYAKAKIPLPGRILTNRIDIGPKHYAIGFTTKDTGQMVGKFQGFHADRVFVIVSEAQAVENAIFEQIDAILTGDIGLMIQIGNPLRASGRFADDIKAKDRNIVLRLSCLDNPNYIEKKTIVPGLASYEWVEDKRARWGVDDPRWSSRVLGQIPKSSIDNVFSQALIDKMMKYKTKETRCYRGTAVDVGRFGDDESVIYGGTNGMIEKTDAYTGLSTTATASRALIVNGAVQGNFIIIDGDGVGGGTIDTLRDMRLGEIDVVEIHSAGKADDTQFENLRAEMWFKAKNRAEEGNASVPGDDPALIEELMEVKYFFNKKGKIQIEPKEDIKERLGRSPNRADAWVYFQYGMSRARQVAKNDYNSPGGTIRSGRVSSSVYGRVGAMAA